MRLCVTSSERALTVRRLKRANKRSLKSQVEAWHSGNGVGHINEVTLSK